MKGIYTVKRKDGMAVSNVWRPWYEPMPLSPTPPQGIAEFEMCRSVPFTHTPPELVPSTTASTRVREVAFGSFPNLPPRASYPSDSWAWP